MHKTNPSGRFGSASPAPSWSIEPSQRIDELGDWATPNTAVTTPQLDSSMRVSQVMQRAAVCVSENASVDEVRVLLLNSGLVAVPVLNARGFPIGVVSAIDILRELPEYETAEVEVGFASSAALDPFMEARDDDAEARESADGFRVMQVLQVAASSIMAPLVCCAKADASVRSAALVMAAEQVHHLPVVDAEGRLVGMLCSLDLVGVVAGLPPRLEPGPWCAPRLILGVDP